MFDSMVGCALIPRFALTSVLAERREMLGRPLALAPQPGDPQVIGEVSAAAETFGVRAGMRLAEALGRCPALVLVPGDPVRAEAVWEETLRRLEGIGAAVEPARPGEAFFQIESLRALYGSPEAILVRGRRALGSARLGAGPTRLCAFSAAKRMRARRPPPVIGERAAGRLIAGLPLAALRDAIAWARIGGGRGAAAEGRVWRDVDCVDSLERLGVRTLGELAELPADALADRFGETGLLALRIARGADEPLRPRHPHEELLERLTLPEAASGQQLERALGLLVERLLAHPARAARTFRRLRLEARLAGGGGWRAEVTLRNTTASAERLRLALAPQLTGLPGPAAVLGLRATALGPASPDQPPLSRSPEEGRRLRLAEAVRQVRAAAGRDAVLKVVEVEPDSRVPERRALLTPFPTGGERG